MSRQPPPPGMRRLPGVRRQSRARGSPRWRLLFMRGPAREDILNWNYSTGILRLTSCAYLRSNPPAMRAPPPSSMRAPGCSRTELFSQVSCIAAYGGVVPELASARHVRRLLRWCAARWRGRGASPATSTGWPTRRPGLIGALLTGASLARSLAYAWACRPSACTHLEGHLLAPLLEADPPPFPASGAAGVRRAYAADRGVRGGTLRVLGTSRDDAAGEAFDKTAKLLGLPYPGGPQLAQLAERGTPGAFSFPRPCSTGRGSSSAFRA